jgi:hypothetical protein
MKHLVLLGDSIFDNSSYVGGGPDVCQQLRQKLPKGWRATLLAQDGSVTADVQNQLQNLPDSATHLLISSGGNDALQQFDLLDDSVSTVAEALEIPGEAVDFFRQSNRSMLASAIATGLPTAVCTIYRPNFDDPVMQRVACAALAWFNDVILEEAFRHQLPVLDLRFIFTAPEDYANPIEPSVIGGAKLADRIRQLFLSHKFKTKATRIYF